MSKLDALKYLAIRPRVHVQNVSGIINLVEFNCIQWSSSRENFVFSLIRHLQKSQSQQKHKLHPYLDTSPIRCKARWNNAVILWPSYVNSGDLMITLPDPTDGGQVAIPKNISRLRYVSSRNHHIHFSLTVHLMKEVVWPNCAVYHSHY